jgi:pyridoxal phosphate enzyme (YggS family)
MPEEVRLVAVIKEVGVAGIGSAWEAGVEEFGENYAADLATKRRGAPGATWHFIGRLQRGTVKKVLDSSDVIQTLEPGKAGDRLARLAEERGRSAACLVEVDFAGERVGVAPEHLEGFVDSAATRAGLQIVGLMTVPPLGAHSRPYFDRLRTLRDGLMDRHPGVRELSMGMSGDYEEAVEEGATMVRIGTAIFGPRPGSARGAPQEA